MGRISFRIWGDPKGKARPRVLKNGRAYTPKTTADYELRVLKECRETMQLYRTFGWMDGEPLVMDIQAYFSIPKSYSKKKVDLIERGFVKPTKKPDADNIAKIICDALNGALYKDDAQIVSLHVSKHYTKGEPYVRVKVEDY